MSKVHATFQIIEKDPFRLFFPYGALLGIIGMLPWAAFFF